MDANDMQRRMQDIQRNEDFAGAFSKIVSGGRPGYKAVIEKKKIILRCGGCGAVLDDGIKFCSECGTRVVKPAHK